MLKTKQFTWKEQYIQVALQVSKMADYANKNKESIQQENEEIEKEKKAKEVMPVDKYVGVPQLLPHGSPEIEMYSDEKLKQYGNKDVSQLRKKFKDLQTMQTSLDIKTLDLKCGSDNVWRTGELPDCFQIGFTI